MVCKLSNEEVLNKLNKWKLTEDNRSAIKRDFKFDDFKTAFSFMTKVALKAEEIGHHPEWYNVYNKINIVLTTHDVAGLSEKDIILANFLDKEFEKETDG